MKQTALQILLVEDNAGDARLLREMFSKESPDSFKLTHLLRMSEAETHLENSKVDIVLLDMGLPDGHGLDTVRRARKAAPGVPMIVLTGLDDEALAAQALKEGAQDYLIKGQIENRALPRALRHAIERHRMQTETDLIRTNQLQFKDEFLSHVSHELRSPLTAIRQFVGILLDNLVGEVNAEQRQYLDIVLRNAKQLQSMINDLFEVSGFQAGKLKLEIECISASDAIVYAVNTLQGAATAKGVVLSCDLDPRLPSVCADPSRLRQILIILVDNAIKFIPANGGAVTIRARIYEKDPHLLVLEVSDTGCGISPEATKRIFERLFQASDPASAGRKGLGLGLYICKELVTRQGGTIWAKNAPGKGAVFSLTIPVFSLESLIAPAFRKESQNGSQLTLVITEIGSKTGWLSDQVRMDHSREIRQLLQGCLHSDLDILLPKMGSTGAVEVFFVVAATDGIGGEAISRRIREQLENSEHIQKAGLTVLTSHRLVGIRKQNAGEPVGAFLEKAARKIRELMNNKLALRMVANGK